VTSAENNRLPVEPAEVARVLGGGLVEGSVVLLGGEPGVGKSTLLTGLALWWVRQGLKVIYVTGEESPAQIRMRAERLGFSPAQEEGFHLLPEVQLESLMETLDRETDAGGEAGGCGSTVIIADSVQTLHSEHIDSFPGSPTQIRYCGGVLADFARRSGHPVFLVGHVTKSGDLAGPKLLEHMVDTVLYFEGSGGGPIRMVRAVKNRFGTTGELAVLEMRAEGLVPVAQACVLFLPWSRPRGTGRPSGWCRAWTTSGWPCWRQSSKSGRAWIWPVATSSSRWPAAAGSTIPEPTLQSLWPWLRPFANAPYPWTPWSWVKSG
jgi:DNA repair protein RadA/Sms